MPWTPEPYQLRAVQWLLDNGAAGLFLDPGLRKTSCVLAAYMLLKQEQGIGPMLVIAPIRVCYLVWPAEVAKWAEFSHLKVEVLHGSKKDEAVKRDADIYVINPEGLEWLFDVTKTRVEKRDGSFKTVLTNNLKTRFSQLGISVLAIDEASKFRNSNSGRFKMLKPLLGLFERRWAMTGSPRPRSMMDLFGLMYVIDEGRSLGQYISHFRSAYFHPSGYGGYTWDLNNDGEELIYERIAPVVFRLDAKDYLELPELVPDPIYVELPSAARKAYDELEKEFITEVDATTITAASSGVAAMKCRQIASGALYTTQVVDDDGKRIGAREYTLLHTAKADALVDLIEDLNGAQVLVAYEFKTDLVAIKNALGDGVAVFGAGKISDDRRIERDWNSGKLPVVCGHPASMGHGLNLQGSDACHVFWYTLTRDYELFDQLVRRLLRSGNKASRVFVHVAIAKDTVDEVTYASNWAKAKGQDEFNSAMSDYTERRRIDLNVPAFAKQPAAKRAAPRKVAAKKLR